MTTADCAQISANKLLEMARRLAFAMQYLDSSEMRLALLKQLARRLGDEAYPEFLKLLMIVAEGDNSQVQLALAEAIALALRRSDLPMGTLSAWGRDGQPSGWPETLQVGPNAAALSLGSLAALRQRSSIKRSFGPVEYLTLWFCQPTQRPYLSDRGFRYALQRLLELLNQHPDMRVLYPQRIQNDLQHSPEGAFTRQTRLRLSQLASAWSLGSHPVEIANVVAEIT